MNIESPIVLIPLITGPLFVLAGIIMLKFPPREINGLYGYRTFRSMKNQERWDFAQHYSAKEMIKLGGLLLLTSILGLLYQPVDIISLLIGIGLLIIMVTFLFIRVEKAIKARFEDNS
jgi:uncharacterized membrane protein